MEIPEEQAWSKREGNLISLVRQLIACEDTRQDRLLKTAFYDCLKEKFFDRLRKAASKRYRGIPDWEGRMREIFNDTFRIALEDIKTFKLGEGWDEAECQKVILNWMSKISNNLLMKLTRVNREEVMALNVFYGIQRYDLASGQDLERKNPMQTYDKVKFDKFWEKLNPMSRDILLACADLGTIKEESGSYLSDNEIEFLKIKNETESCARSEKVSKAITASNHKERNTDHLPDDVLEYLKKEYNAKPATIRKAKQRALEGLRKCKL